MSDTLRKSVLLAMCVMKVLILAAGPGQQAGRTGLTGDQHRTTAAQKRMKKSRNNCLAFMKVCPFSQLCYLFAWRD